MASINPEAIAEDHLVKGDPVIGLNYHISWARKRGMLWKLVKIDSDTAHLVTPKTKKPVTCKVSELRETNNRVNRNAFNRLTAKYKLI